MNQKINETAVTAPVRRLSVVDRWIIFLVVALVATLIVIASYKSASKSLFSQAALFVLFLVIYVLPTAIALRSSCFQGFLRYFFGLTAVPVFVGLFVLSLSFVNGFSFFEQGLVAAQNSGFKKAEVVFVIIAAAPAAIIFCCWYKALAMLSRVISSPTTRGDHTDIA